MSFEIYSTDRIELINSYLEDSIIRYRHSASQRFSLLIDAMQYSLEAGGKRLRPLLLLASAEAIGLSPRSVLPAAAAIEYIHTYSLIHDDLPALDDDDTRRGKPSSHRKFGEAVAILAGDALLTEAFTQMTRLSESQVYQPAQILAALEFLAQSSGVRGMVGGQLIDVTLDTKSTSLPEIEFIHIHKTGAMIVASILIPTKLATMDAVMVQKFKRYGETLGLAFQISDDILDSESAIRYSRGPRKKPKPSYSDVMSPSEMKEKLNLLIDTAIQSVESLGDKSKPLVDIANFVRTRRS